MEYLNIIKYRCKWCGALVKDEAITYHPIEEDDIRLVDNRFELFLTNQDGIHITLSYPMKKVHMCNEQELGLCKFIGLEQIEYV